MSDYPMLISNKLHSFRNFASQSYVFSPERTKKIYYRKHHGQTEIPTSLPARYICNDYNYPYYTSSLAFLPLNSAFRSS